jgi:hypothetical protein
MKAVIFSELERSLIAGTSIKKIIGRRENAENGGRTSVKHPARNLRRPSVPSAANIFFITFHVRPRGAVVKSGMVWTFFAAEEKKETRILKTAAG